MVPCFRRDVVWTLTGVYPDENRGRNDAFWSFYVIINYGLISNKSTHPKLGNKVGSDSPGKKKLFQPLLIQFR